MVGAGGIGCELLKNLVMMGIGEVEVVDLDTIDLSNLNRQFLFQHKHIGKAKAHVARESALQFNPKANITSHLASIFESRFDIAWFKSFDLVLNALDNVAARKHVNGMCLAAGVPLIESGTEGFNGQVILHTHPLTSCYECDGKPSKKTYPVCTIRSTPSQPIHCIVWAKSFLYSQLFGKPEEEDATIDEDDASDNAKEMAHLRKEKEALNRLRESAGTAEYGKIVFQKVFTDDVKGLLVMEDLWKSRKPPTPLEYDQVASKTSTPSNGDTPNALEWDRKIWTVQENTSVFLDSLQKLTATLLEERRNDPDHTLAFDKDDEDSLNFVTATANLRAEVYGLEKKSRFEVKEMAGNIIPAVATTNAIIAGLIVMTAIKVLSGKADACKNAWVSQQSAINPERLHKPNPQCGACSTHSFVLSIDVDTATLGEVVDEVIERDAMQEGDDLAAVVLYDPDFDDNRSMTLSALGVKHGSKIVVTNEDDDYPDGSRNYSINLFVQHR
ncbi:uncharacterized protein EV422DRAFT_551792 [Fimicolochytrium jonesii]|uniref:uncharacterized protein n=1 Tax=Fimicolochytrium jonesii TaxID=1396493 RepID=UPI0022FDD75B|nr:uncharacterized protein EV422DRAFT_551792 [Fimicolochytrium jonesii]KAI8816015.1 hypothetical protein EV422DRAFT_551792 [Fimicolochytrium jonesii]